MTLATTTVLLAVHVVANIFEGAPLLQCPLQTVFEGGALLQCCFQTFPQHLLTILGCQELCKLVSRFVIPLTEPASVTISVLVQLLVSFAIRALVQLPQHLRRSRPVIFPASLQVMYA